MKIANIQTSELGGRHMKIKLGKFLKSKFSKLKEEGYEAGPQRTAIALNYARRKGFKIPKPTRDTNE